MPSRSKLALYPAFTDCRVSTKIYIHRLRRRDGQPAGLPFSPSAPVTSLTGATCDRSALAGLRSKKDRGAYKSLPSFRFCSCEVIGDLRSKGSMEIEYFQYCPARAALSRSAYDLWLFGTMSSKALRHPPIRVCRIIHVWRARTGQCPIPIGQSSITRHPWAWAPIKSWWNPKKRRSRRPRAPSPSAISPPAGRAEPRPGRSRSHRGRSPVPRRPECAGSPHQRRRRRGRA